MNIKLEDSDSVQHLQQSIASQESLVAELNRDLAALNTQIERHLAQKERLLTTLAHSRALVAPIRRLPVEIIGMIFVECVEDPGGARHRSLALVCRWWKDILWTTPFAWSRISIALNDSGRSMRMAKSFVRRARKSSLAIEVEVAQNQSDIKDLLLEFLKITSRSAFRSITVNASRRVPSSVVSSFLECLLCLLHPRDAQCLDTFRLKTWGDLLPNAARFRRGQLDCFTAIRVLDIPHDLIKPTAKFLAGLTSLTVSSSHNPQVSFDLSILQACPQLQQLCLIDFGRPVKTTPKAVTLPHLTSLHFSKSSVRILFSYLRAPSLRTLILEDIALCPTYELTTALKEFVVVPAQGPPPVTTLKLINSKFNQQGLIWALDRLPTLVELEIGRSSKVTSAFVAALQKEATARRGWMLPNLKRLILTRCCNVTASMLRGVVKARVRDVAEVKPAKGRKHHMEPPCPLESVLLENTDITALEASLY